MNKWNPDHVDSSVIESASSKNTDAVPSTEKTERRGGMVGVVKPSCHKVKLQDVVRPPDIQIVFHLLILAHYNRKIDDFEKQEW
jgi:hypothetical protein